MSLVYSQIGIFFLIWYNIIAYLKELLIIFIALILTHVTMLIGFLLIFEGKLEVLAEEYRGAVDYNSVC